MLDQSWSLELIVKYIEHSLIEPFLNLYKFALQTVYIVRSNEKFLRNTPPSKMKSLLIHPPLVLIRQKQQTDLNFLPAKSSIMWSEMEVPT